MTVSSSNFLFCLPLPKNIFVIPEVKINPNPQKGRGRKVQDSIRDIKQRVSHRKRKWFDLIMILPEVVTIRVKQPISDTQLLAASN